MNQIQFTDGRTFTPSKVLCVGLNYAKHIEEMNSKRTREPVLFLKPNSALRPITEPLTIPQDVGAVHHELELAVCLTASLTNATLEEAQQAIGGYGLALDLTLRDMQGAAKKAGLPWAVAKGFNGACPVSPFKPAEQIPDAGNLQIKLIVNGSERQKGNTEMMLFKIPDLLVYATRFFSFEPGDLLLTGTPPGVGPLHSGDRLEASIAEIGTFSTHVL